MKHFITTNWYRITTATSLFILACGFFAFAIKYNTAQAGNPLTTASKQFENTWIVTMGSKFYLVAWNGIE